MFADFRNKDGTADRRKILFDEIVYERIKVHGKVEVKYQDRS